jgi:peptidoglycan LD-endopeptidase CwlK
VSRVGLVVMGLLCCALPAPLRADEVPVRLQCLIDAYPDHLDVAVLDPAHGWMVRWKDGTSMDWDDGRTDKNFQEKLDDPDLEDQMFIAYPAGRAATALGVDDDPGRIRYEPFFRKMYGASKKEVQQRLVIVRWLPESVARKLRATDVNGVDKALARVSTGLSRLPAPVRRIAESTSGPFNWRTIKGTKRLSVHSFAIGLDIGVDVSDYWRWHKPDKNGRFAYRNRIPLEIVEVFESCGFIWGGRWYHFDTMHFEYRPELLDKRCLRRQTP